MISNALILTPVNKSPVISQERSKVSKVPTSRQLKVFAICRLLNFKVDFYGNYFPIEYTSNPKSIKCLASKIFLPSKIFAGFTTLLKILSQS